MINLQNSLCCTISCYLCFQSILGGNGRQFSHKIIIQELLVWIVGWIKIHPYVINTHPWGPLSKLTWHAKDLPSCWCQIDALVHFYQTYCKNWFNECCVIIWWFFKLTNGFGILKIWALKNLWFQFYQFSNIIVPYEASYFFARKQPDISNDSLVSRTFSLDMSTMAT
jgi:hypothetical protein